MVCFILTSIGTTNSTEVEGSRCARGVSSYQVLDLQTDIFVLWYETLRLFSESAVKSPQPPESCFQVVKQ